MNIRSWTQLYGVENSGYEMRLFGVEHAALQNYPKCDIAIQNALHGGKKGVSLWSAKIELKISCENFYMLSLLDHHSSARPTLSQHIFLFAF